MFEIQNLMDPCFGMEKSGSAALRHLPNTLRGAKSIIKPTKYLPDSTLAKIRTNAAKPVPTDIPAPSSQPILKQIPTRDEVKAMPKGPARNAARTRLLRNTNKTKLNEYLNKQLQETHYAPAGKIHRDMAEHAITGGVPLSHPLTGDAWYKLLKQRGLIYDGPLNWGK